jgi:hypothetical protein
MQARNQTNQAMEKILGSSFPTQFFGRPQFLLGKRFIQRKKNALFETAELFFRQKITVECQGTRCESGTVAPL